MGHFLESTRWIDRVRFSSDHFEILRATYDGCLMYSKSNALAVAFFLETIITLVLKPGWHAQCQVQGLKYSDAKGAICIPELPFAPQKQSWSAKFALQKIPDF